ncbi:hypothetical protein IQ273_10940 [Nodosilinea sp. LEGE 07298]|uniref:hypothetical protein n=1 Tax=Nodosilinea sp. LEGE 07298 TaxID=2777970 RepID=UPI001881CE96|nr:hypothetical protein [Nodosilinea sp. LEGE 07298]MBE9109923.1 hypothetical protein [Nodosilinea sp. LEGE 07298]
MAKYALPFEEILQLVLSCLTGSFPKTFNKLQFNLQDSPMPRKAKNIKDLNKLNKLGAQYNLYLGILERLEVEDVGSRERISRTAETFKRKNRLVGQRIRKSGRIPNIRFMSMQQKAIDFLSFGLTADYRSLESLISEVVEVVEYKDILGSSEVSRQVNKLISAKRDVVSSSGINAVDNFKYIFDILNFGSNQVETPTGDVFSSRGNLRNLFAENERLSNLVDSLTQNNERLRENFNNRDKELNELRNLIFSRDKELDELRKRAAQVGQPESEFPEVISRKENEYRKLEAKFRQRQGDLDSITLQAQAMSEQIRKLLQEKEDLKQQLNELITDRFAEAGLGKSNQSLNGKFIGNIGNPQTKYHFSPNCPDWWALVGQYLYGKGVGDKRIISSESPNFFEIKGLDPCIKCSTDMGIQ